LRNERQPRCRELLITFLNILAVNNLTLVPVDYQPLPVKLGPRFGVDLVLDYILLDTVDGS